MARQDKAIGRLAWAIPWVVLIAAGPAWAAGAADAPTPAAPAPLTPAPAPRVLPPTCQRVSNLWVETDLRQVMQDISAQTDTVIICDQTVQGSVSMSVKDMSLEDCLERVCSAGGCSFVKVKDYYLVGRAEPGSPLFQRMSEPLLVKLANVQPDQIRALLHGSMLPYITCDKSSGTVVITAPQPLRQRIVDAIRQIDQPNQQVAIDAVVFELTEEGTRQLGLDWQYQHDRTTVGSDSLVNTITYNAASDMGTYVAMTLNAIVETQKGQVLANPRLLVVNNTQAELFVGQDKYFTLLSGQASNPYYTLQSIKAGVTLKVLPYIGEKGQITLELEPEVSDVQTDTTTTNATGPQSSVTNALPVVTSRHAKTTISIKDGQTILIGGLLREENRDTVSKVPLLGDIPILGAAFSSIQHDKVQQEVVILITAQVCDPHRTGVDSMASRLEPRYVTPLDAIAAPIHEQAKRK